MKQSLADQMSCSTHLNCIQLKIFKHPVTEEQCHFLEEYVNSDECHNDFQEYFNYCNMYLILQN